MKQVFETQMDNTVKMITIITHFAIIPIPLVLWFQAGWELAILNLLLLICIFGLAYLFRPYQYLIEDGQIIIQKTIFPKKIPLNNIETITSVEYKDLKVRLRLWGSGGLWGWYGIFVSTEYGNIRLQITEKENLVLIATKDGKHIVISPKHRADFFKALNQKK
jgi:hypothetical protein